MDAEPSSKSLGKEEKRTCLNKEYAHFLSMAQRIRDHVTTL
jgi:hypothetical protein